MPTEPVGYISVFLNVVDQTVELEGDAVPVELGNFLEAILKLPVVRAWGTSVPFMVRAFADSQLSVCVATFKVLNRRAEPAIHRDDFHAVMVSSDRSCRFYLHQRCVGVVRGEKWAHLYGRCATRAQWWDAWHATLPMDKQLTLPTSKEMSRCARLA